MPAVRALQFRETRYQRSATGTAEYTSRNDSTASESHRGAKYFCNWKSYVRRAKAESVMFEK